jgi:hypothetical protein
MNRRVVVAFVALLAACGGSSKVAVTTITATTTTAPTIAPTTTTAATAPSTSAAASPATTTEAAAHTTTTAPIAPSTEHYVFPVQPVSVTGYAHTHHDYPATDIIAPCGSRFVAPTSGTILELRRTDPWNPKVNDPATRGGMFVSMVGDDGVRYYGAHLEVIRSGLVAGSRVTVGEQLGLVGQTGDARLSVCHLHLGISPPCPQEEWAVRRGVIWPWPYLDAWKAGVAKSPAAEVRAWAAANPSACTQASSLPTAGDG